jgi:membrane protease YdiL (CAAX protease family)
MILQELQSSINFKKSKEKDIFNISVFACLMLILKEYFGSAFQIYPILEYFNLSTLVHFFRFHKDAHFYKQLYWLLGCYFFYFLIPICYVLFNKIKLEEVGWRLSVPKKHFKIYFFIVILIVPVIIVAATTERFKYTYPFFKFNPEIHSWNQFIIWEVGYMFQFVAVEFFFRGFLLFNISRIIGNSAVYFSLLPYCMIHFGKPLPETIGAIVAGIVLGKMALASRSIFPGILIHCIVGCLMDCLSVYHQLF